MKATQLVLRLLSMGIFSFCRAGISTETNAALDYNEVREVIRVHLPGVTEVELDRGALEGLLHTVRGKVSIVSETNIVTVSPITQATSPADGVGYLRLISVKGDVATEITTAFNALNSTNKLTGLIVDLRYAAGDDYAAAARVADLFIADERPLIDSGSGIVKSTAKTNALSFPVILLVNGETVGAAEALPEIMRDQAIGLIIGDTTRGAAMTSREFALKNGSKLRIADAPVKIGAGSIALDKGVTPDIVVTVSESDERAYMADAYATPARSNSATNDATTATNITSTTKYTPRRARLTEADLVRARREGVRIDEDLKPQTEVEPERPTIRDPALARAIDLLKGLAVVRRTRQ